MLNTYINADEIIRINNVLAVCCLDISANNFQTNMATGKMLTPMCFFRKGTPKFVYIDIKRSPPNFSKFSQFSQYKFNLRSTQI